MQRDKEIQIQQFKAETDQAKANADVAYQLQEIRNKEVLAEREATLAKKQAVVAEEQLVAQVNKPADAAKYKLSVEADTAKIAAIKQSEARGEAVKIEAEARAAATKIQAEADAAAITLRGQADASAILAKGIAEATSREKLAEAMKKYGDAAVVEMVINRMPDIVAAIAKPMEQIGQMTVIDNGGNEGASKVSKTITNIAGNGFQAIKDMTGIDVSKLIESFTSMQDTPPYIDEDYVDITSDEVPPQTEE